MNNLQTHMKNYLEHCKNQKRLDGKTTELPLIQEDKRQR